VASGKVMEHLGFTPFLTTTGEMHGEDIVVTELTVDRWEAAQRHG